MTKRLLIAGGGLAGLAAALACTRAGWRAQLYEQAPAFSEVGAGIQLGPNATRILRGWGLDSALNGVAACPQCVLVRRAPDGALLGQLRLGAAFTERYGAPYVTVHRADLHGLLLQAVRRMDVDLHLSSRVSSVKASSDAVSLDLNDDHAVEGDALVGADGLWSAVRRYVRDDGLPVSTGHLAYRGLALQRDLPERLRSQDITVWLGPRMHLVAYPVRGGDQLNVVAIVQGTTSGAPHDWDQVAVAAELQGALGPCAPLRDLVQAISDWRLWALHDRVPVQGPDEMVHGRIALLGDAAHPMLPYLAQGAGMAIEDAAELARVLAMAGMASDVPAALSRYAHNRWRRCARVQHRSQSNGVIFHSTGPLRWGRDMAMGLLGERLLDIPWLYR